MIVDNQLQFSALLSFFVHTPAPLRLVAADGSDLLKNETYVRIVEPALGPRTQSAGHRSALASALGGTPRRIPVGDIEGTPTIAYYQPIYTGSEDAPPTHVGVAYQPAPALVRDGSIDGRRAATPSPDRHPPAARVVCSARRFSRLLQCALVSVHRSDTGRDQWRRLARRPSCGPSGSNGAKGFESGRIDCVCAFARCL